MQIVKDKISLEELKKMSAKMHESIVKAVVDVEQEIMVVDAEMHSDEEALLLEEGSQQENLWGINFHPNESDNEKFVEFDSMINVRPMQNNRTRYVQDHKIREKIIAIVKRFVKK